jgi:hypothetical protein
MFLGRCAVEIFLLFWRCRRLVFGFPVIIGHAINVVACIVLAEGEAFFRGGILQPVGQAIAAEACKVHQIDVLHITSLLQMADQTAQDCRLQFRLGFIVHVHGLEIELGGTNYKPQSAAFHNLSWLTEVNHIPAIKPVEMQ